MKMAEVLRKVRSTEEGVQFVGLFDLPCFRYEIVLTFLALLELLRMGRVRAEQQSPLSEIILFPIHEAAA